MLKRVILFVAVFFSSTHLAVAAGGELNQEIEIWKIIVTILVPVIAGFIAYVLKIRADRRQLEISFVSEQLKDLYGPLMALSRASKEAWKAFCDRNDIQNGFHFNPDSPPTQADIVEWRHWMKTVFFPFHLKFEEIIIKNMHLIEGSTVPISFLKLLAHIASYKAVGEKWDKNPPEEHVPFEKMVRTNTALIDFPEDFHNDALKTFNYLKLRQHELLKTKAFIIF